MQSPKIESLYQEYKELYDYLLKDGQISYAISVDNTYKKALLISCASFFEFTIINAIVEFTSNVSSSNEKLMFLIQHKTLERQYHTLFDWDKSNSNKFFSLFGEKTKNNARDLIDRKSQVDNEQAFLEIGRKRNTLVHDNFIESTVNNTCADIYNKYILAGKFVDLLIEIINS